MKQSQANTKRQSKYGQTFYYLVVATLQRSYSIATNLTGETGCAALVGDCDAFVGDSFFLGDEALTEEVDTLIGDAGAFTGELDSFVGDGGLAISFVGEADSLTSEAGPLTSLTGEDDPLTGEADPFTGETDPFIGEAGPLIGEADTFSADLAASLAGDFGSLVGEAGALMIKLAGAFSFLTEFLSLPASLTASVSFWEFCTSTIWTSLTAVCPLCPPISSNCFFQRSRRLRHRCEMSFCIMFFLEMCLTTFAILVSCVRIYLLDIFVMTCSLWITLISLNFRFA
jgi:hypothetical protein